MRFSVVVLLVFCMLSFAGCQKNAIHNDADVEFETSNVVQGDDKLNSSDKSNGNIKKAVSITENPGQMELNGLSHLSGTVKTDKNILEIRIQSNPTTGYQWSWQDDSEGKILSNERDEFLPPSEFNERGERLAGAGGIHIFKFNGLAQGTSILTFTYRRSWEQPKENDIVYRLEISVSEDNKISKVIQLIRN